MKLFNAIAAATVIGTSIMAATPAEARNGWIYVGSSDGAAHYVKPLGRSGVKVSYISNWSDMNPYQITVNCKTWYQISDVAKAWRPIMPESNSEHVANLLC